MSQSRLYEEMKSGENVRLGDFLKTPDDSVTCYFMECDLKNADSKKKKTKNFPFCPENETSPQEKFNDYVNEMKPNTYTEKKDNI